MREINKVIAGVMINTLVFTSVVYAGQEVIKKNIEENEIECLALNIYFETKAVSLSDAMAVTDVVLNRTNHAYYPNDICSVVYQSKTDSNGFPKRHKCQFSWYCDGRGDTPTDITSWERSRKYARDMYVHRSYIGITEGATHYHATYVKPRWSKELDRIARIGSHIFYRMKDKK